MWMPGIFSSCRMLPITSCTRDVGADGELAHAVAVLVGVAIAPELVLQLAVGAVRLLQAAVSHRDGQRLVAQVAVFFAEVIAHHAIDHEGAVHALGRGEGLAAGQVAPLVRADDAAGLEPFEFAARSGPRCRCRRDWWRGSRAPRWPCCHTCVLMRSTSSKSARMPSSMIRRSMFTMWAWRILRRFTTSVICMRVRSSLACAFTAKMLTWLVSMSSRTARGMSPSGPRRQVFQHPGVVAQARRSSSLRQRRARSREHARSVISVTFSSGWMRRQRHRVARARDQCGVERRRATAWSSLMACPAPLAG